MDKPQVERRKAGRPKTVGSGGIETSVYVSVEDRDALMRIASAMQEPEKSRITQSEILRRAIRFFIDAHSQE